MEAKILKAVRSPKQLETLYREEPRAFERAFPVALARHPKSTILRVWQERLGHKRAGEARRPRATWSWSGILTVVLLTAIAGTILQLPLWSPTLDHDWLSTRGWAWEFIVPVLAYFGLRRNSTKFAVSVLVIATAALLYLSLLPGRVDDPLNIQYTYIAFSDALTAAELHITLFLWLLVGVAFAGRAWKETGARLAFIRYNGELLMYTAILLLGAGVLFLTSQRLFDFIDYDLSSWYQEHVLGYLIVAAPITATYLIDKVIDRRLNIAPTIARFFTPLFLISMLGYVLIMVLYHKDPSADREYLVTLNVLLILTLALLAFTIAERGPGSPATTGDYLNIGLAGAMILLDAAALIATLSRLMGDEHGLTPNRIVVLGMNFLIFAHVAGILINYVRFVWRRRPFEAVNRWIAGFLPCYAIWAVLVSILLPVLFWYK